MDSGSEKDADVAHETQEASFLQVTGRVTHTLRATAADPVHRGPLWRLARSRWSTSEQGWTATRSW